MERLIATFSLSLPTYIWLNRLEASSDWATAFPPPHRDGPYLVRLDGIDVAITIISRDGPRLIQNGVAFRSAAELDVAVSRLESQSPPEPVRTSGGIDLSAASVYFSDRYPDFKAAAIIAVNRLLGFFKFNLRTPLLTKVAELSFSNPEWSDESGRTYLGGALEIQSHVSVPWGGSLGPQNVQDLQAALSVDNEPTLAEELLLEAIGSLKRGELRRAIMDAGICCEVATRSAFLGASAKQPLVATLVEKGFLNFDVLRFIHPLAKELTGRSFCEERSADYDSIAQLINARNHVAHGGLVQFKGASGRVEPVRTENMKRWFEAIESLFLWFKSF